MTTDLPASLVTNRLISTWLTITGDGTVALRVGKVELGQGITTALTQIAAHELDVAPESVTAGATNTASSPDEGLTAGSLSITFSGAAVRRVCAEARELFRRAAAKTAGLDVTAVRLSSGVFVTADGTRIGSYAELAAAVDLERREQAPGEALVLGLALLGQGEPAAVGLGLAPLDGVADRPSEHRPVDLALDEVVLGARGDGLDPSLAIAETGEHDDGQLGGGGPQRLDRLQPAGVGQPEVHQRALGDAGLLDALGEGPGDRQPSAAQRRRFAAARVARPSPAASPALETHPFGPGDEAPRSEFGTVRGFGHQPPASSCALSPIQLALHPPATSHRN